MCPHPRRASAAVARDITELIQRSGVRAVDRRARGICAAKLTVACYGVSTYTLAAGAVAATALSAAGAEAGALSEDAIR
jgi:hypothetical protein